MVLGAPFSGLGGFLGANTAFHPVIFNTGAIPTFINLATWGTFSRASEGTYLVAAPGTGSTPYLRFASNDVRRFEDRGDGNGQMLLLEGTTTNLMYYSQDFASTWNPAGATITTNSHTAPDGTYSADRIQQASGGSGVNQSRGSVTSAGDFIGTYYSRAPSGTADYQTLCGYAGVTSVGGSQGTTWTRYEMARLPNDAVTTIGLYVGDGRAVVIPAGARDEVAWGAQIEEGQFATSYMRTLGNAIGVRAADILSGPITTVPSAMINGTFSFDIAPVFSSARGIRKNADQCIFSFAEDDSERIYFYVLGGVLYIRIVSGGVEKVKSNALTFSAHQKLSVTVNATSGSITVAGATTGNGTVTGTPWTRTTGSTMYVGSRQGGAQALFARLGPVQTPPSAAKIVLFMLGQSNMQVNSITSKILSEVQKTYPNAKKVEYAAGGTTLYSDWNKSGAGHVTYDSAVAAWNAAYAADPELASYTPIIVWGQGETDSSSGGWATNYASGLTRLFTDLETDIPFLAGCKKIIHMLYPTCGLDTSPGQVNAATIRTAESGYQAAHPTLVATVETSDLTTYDTIHYDDASTTTLAQRDAAIVRGWIA